MSIWASRMRATRGGFAVRLARARSQDVGQLAVSVIWTSSRTRPSSIRNTCAAADFAQQEWPPEIQQRLNDAQRRIAAAFDRLGRRVRVPGRERIAFALADIPLALVRRHLKAGRRSRSAPRTSSPRRPVRYLRPRRSSANRPPPGPSRRQQPRGPIQPPPTAAHADDNRAAPSSNQRRAAQRIPDRTSTLRAVLSGADVGSQPFGLRSEWRGNPSSGSSSQDARESTKMWYCGLMPGSPSSVPSRMPITGPSGHWPRPRLEPQVRQNTTGLPPPAGLYEASSSSPASSRKPSGTVRPLSPARAPVSLRQREQWQ